MTQYAALPTLRAFKGQYLKALVFPFTFAEFNAQGATFTPVMQFPAGAIPITQNLVVTTIWATTTATVSFGTSASPASVLAATSLKVAASTALTIASSSSAQTFGPTFAVTGGPAAVGEACIYVTYIIPSSQDFTQGDNLQATI